MSVDIRKQRKAEKAQSKAMRKDRLIQTRVDRRLQAVLVDEARRRRMSVSNLVRGVLEDAFGLTDPDVGPVLDPAVTGQAAPPPTALPPSLQHIYAWNTVVLGTRANCSRCLTPMVAGDAALFGLSDDASAERAWLCGECGEEL